MCRFVAYLGEPIALDLLLFKPKNSLVNQSLDAKQFRLRVNGDGFGVAFYREGRGDPVRLRTVTPAWNNQNLRSIAPAFESTCILAHVRAASPGLPVVETNCHPFVSGPYAFCHNGAIDSFQSVRRALLAELPDAQFDGIQGTTDSELLFAMFLQEMEQAGAADDPSDAMAKALTATIRRTVEASPDALSYLNLCVTDGARMACTRYSNSPTGEMSTLYFHQGRRYICEGDSCRMVEPGDARTTAIIASEPLSDDDGWEEVPGNHVGVVREDRTTQAWPIEW